MADTNKTPLLKQFDNHQQLQRKILKHHIYVGELTLTVEPQDLYEVCRILKQDYGFHYLADMGGADHFTDQQRFEVFYNIMNLNDNVRLRVKTFLEEPEDEDELPEVESVTSIWPGANWHEREAYDMYGIRFLNHPDLRRMFLPEDFEYYPLRKEFPLIGIPGSLQIPEKDPPKGYK
jgi:NADH-quinone oxidoreductase subunit C